MKKRLLSILLIAVMLVAMLPAASSAAVEEYDVWVGSTRVTSANASDVIGGDKVSYTPATSTEPAVLEINGMTLTDFYTLGNEVFGIYFKGELVLKVSGGNSISFNGTLSPYDDETHYTMFTAINGQGDLTIIGSGTLTVGAVYPNGSVYGNSRSVMGIYLSPYYGGGTVLLNKGALTIKESAKEGYGTTLVNPTLKFVFDAGQTAQAVYGKEVNISGGNLDFALTSGRTAYGICGPEVNVTGGTIAINATSSDGSSGGTYGINSEAPVISGGADYTATCSGGAKNYAVYNNQDFGTVDVTGMDVTAGTASPGASVSDFSTNYENYSYAHIVGTSYKLWLGDTQVTNSNKDSIPVAGGTAQYDPASNTLTLNNTRIDTSHEYTYNGYAVIYNAISNLKIVTNNVALDAGGADNILYSGEWLTVDGNLAVTGAKKTNIFCAKGLTITGNLNICGSDAGGMGVYAANGITIGGSVDITEDAGGHVLESGLTSSALSNGITIGGHLKGTVSEQMVKNPVSSHPVVIDGDVDIKTTTHTSDTYNGAIYSNGGMTFGGRITVDSASVGLRTYNGDIRFNGSGRANITGVDAAVKFSGATGANLCLNGTGAPMTFTAAAGNKAIADNAGALRLATGTDLSYYDVLTIAPDESSVVYDHSVYYDPTYPVQIPETDGGTVTVSPKNAVSGQKVKLTVTPDEGFKLGELSAKDSRGREIELTKVDDSAYTFKMPSSKVTVEASFELGAFFDDVSEDDWFYDSVYWAARKGIAEGTDETHFSPYEPCSRADIVTFLWRAAGKPETDQASPFLDLEDGAYYSQAVSWAYANGICEGRDEATFDPLASVQRQELATLLYNYAKTKGEGFVGAWMFLLDYNDIDEIDGWADEAMHWCVMKKVLEGDPEQKLLIPLGTATRAEVITMLDRLFQIVK